MWLVNRHKGNPDTLHVTQIDGEAKRITKSETMSDRHQMNSCSYVVLIPFGNYYDYKDWTPGTGYTMSPGDYIFFENPGSVSASTIIDIKNQKESIEVDNFFVVEKRPGVKYQIKVFG